MTLPTRIEVWPSVLRQASEDARGRWPEREVPACRKRLERERLATWIRSEDFEYVCDQLGLDPGVVRKRFKLPAPTLTEAQIERALRHRYRGLDSDTRAEVEFTPLDRGPYLARLRRLNPPEALKKARDDLDSWYNSKIDEEG